MLANQSSKHFLSGPTMKGIALANKNMTRHSEMTLGTDYKLNLLCQMRVKFRPMKSGIL